MSNFCVNFYHAFIDFFLANHCLLRAVLISSISGGGGGGSGGSVKLSSCTLTAGSGASIEAKGGNGGQARDTYGENGLVY